MEVDSLSVGPGLPMSAWPASIGVGTSSSISTEPTGGHVASRAVGLPMDLKDADMHKQFQGSKLKFRVLGWCQAQNKTMIF